MAYFAATNEGCKWFGVIRPLGEDCANNRRNKAGRYNHLCVKAKDLELVLG